MDYNCNFIKNKTFLNQKYIGGMDTNIKEIMSRIIFVDTTFIWDVVLIFFYFFWYLILLYFYSIYNLISFFLSFFIRFISFFFVFLSFSFYFCVILLLYCFLFEYGLAQHPLKPTTSSLTQTSHSTQQHNSILVLCLDLQLLSLAP